jgi:hypothetical protein
LGLKLFWLRPLRPQLRSSRLKFLIFPNLWKRPKNTVRRAAAGKLGHAPLKRNNGGQAIAPRFSSALASRGREGSPHHASQPFAPGSIRVAGDSGSAPATTNAAERPNPIERCRTIDA